MNGDIFVGSEAHGLLVLSFVADDYRTYRVVGSTQYMFGGSTLDTRNDVLNRSENPFNLNGLVSSAINDVAVTALPNAPIDADTGLPVPTIAVATDGGVSVIKDDGNIFDITPWANEAESYHVGFTYDNEIMVHNAWAIGIDSKVYIYEIPNSDLGATDYKEQYSSAEFWNGITAPQNSRSARQVISYGKESLAAAVIQSKEHLLLAERHSDLKANITSSYNTGWMSGDIKLATLMDTTWMANAETIVAPELVTNGGFDTTGPELITNGTFNTDVSNWSMLPNSSIVRTDGTNYPSQPVGAAYIITNTSGSGPSQTFPTIVGETYEVSVNVIYSDQTNQVSEIATIHIGNQSGYTGGVKVSNVPSTGTHTFNFTAQETTTAPMASPATSCTCWTWLTKAQSAFQWTLRPTKLHSWNVRGWIWTKLACR